MSECICERANVIVCEYEREGERERERERERASETFWSEIVN